MTSPKRSMHGDMDPDAALAEAHRVRQSVNRGSRWYVRYLLLFAVLLGGADITVGLAPGRVTMITAMAVTIAAMVALVVYGIRQPVTFRGFGRVHGAVFAAFGVLHAAALIPGMFLFQGQPAWWVPAGLAVAAPFVVGAVHAARRS